MRVITANRLSDGAVVYLRDDDLWAKRITSAARFPDKDAATVLTAVQTRIGEITDVYLIDVDLDGAPTARTALRETIRSAGPTVRTDLGVQAGCSA